MATKHDFNNRTHKGKGKAVFAQVFEDNVETRQWNDDTGAFDAPSEKGPYAQIIIEHDADEFMNLRKSGSMMTKFSKITDEGLEAVKFKRFVEKRTAKGDIDKGKSGLPEVTKADGTRWDFEEDGPIWNGADVEYEIDLVDYPRITGVTTLKSVKVLKNGNPPRDEEYMDDKETEEVPF